MFAVQQCSYGTTADFSHYHYDVQGGGSYCPEGQWAPKTLDI